MIPVERTAVPVEWDEVKTQLMRLATDLGPTERRVGHVGWRFIDSAANALDGNGDKLRQTLAQLSGVGRILADGSGNIVDIIKNLQTFVTALRDSNTQIVQFKTGSPRSTSVLNDSRSDLDAALTNLSAAVGEVQRFIAGSRDQTAEQIQRLADVTQNLVDNHMALENILHVAPNAIANCYNIYNPDTGSIVGGVRDRTTSRIPAGTFDLRRCIGAVENVTAPETAQAVRAVSRSRRCGCSTSTNLPIPDQPISWRSRQTPKRSSTPTRAWHPAARARSPDRPRSRPRCRPIPACRVIARDRPGCPAAAGPAPIPGAAMPGCRPPPSAVDRRRARPRRRTCRDAAARRSGHQP